MQERRPAMLSHDQIWSAIDALADRYKMSPSGLARRAGLDATTFNRSKRIGADGRERWPSTESLAKILVATGASLDEFMGLVAHGARKGVRPRTIPLIGFAQAGAGGFFDNDGLPTGDGWDEVAFPDIGDEHVYALEITGESMAPLYRDGDTIIVSPGAPVRRGDRVVVRTVEGEVMAKELKRKTLKTVELASLNPDHPDRVLNLSDVAFIARVIWASQ
jgi:phage repressor protein C with HTH and peptisase S24 domain